MKGSRLSRVISLLLCAMLVFTLFPVQAFADGADDATVEPPAPDPVPVFTVKFVDWDGSAIASVLVQQGESATAPSHPEREGYVADGWDKDFSAVTEDMTVTAQYKEAEIDGLLTPMVVVPQFHQNVQKAVLSGRDDSNWNVYDYHTGYISV